MSRKQIEKPAKILKIHSIVQTEQGLREALNLSPNLYLGKAVTGPDKTESPADLRGSRREKLNHFLYRANDFRISFRY